MNPTSHRTESSCDFLWTEYSLPVMGLLKTALPAGSVIVKQVDFREAGGTSAPFEVSSAHHVS